MSSSKSAARAALAAQMAAKRGEKKALDSIAMTKSAELFDEMTEEEYQARRQSGRAFVEDDEGVGYDDEEEEGGDEYADRGSGDDAPHDARGMDVEESEEAGVSGRASSALAAARRRMGAKVGNKSAAALSFQTRAAAAQARDTHAPRSITKQLSAAFADDLIDSGLAEEAAAARPLGLGLGLGLGLNPFARAAVVPPHARALGDGGLSDDDMSGAARALPIASVLSPATSSDAPASATGGAAAAGGVARARLRLAREEVSPLLAPSQLRAAAAAARTSPLSFSTSSAGGAPVSPSSDAAVHVSAGFDAFIGGGGEGEEEAPPLPPAASRGGGGGATHTLFPPVEMVPCPARRHVPRALVGAALPSLLFYWMDAVEERGRLFLFGKALANADAHRGASGQPPRFISTCLQVTGLWRTLFVLPRERSVAGEPVTPADVYAELRRVMASARPAIPTWRCKKVTRNYAFEVPGVPHAEAEYMKLALPAQAHVPLTRDSSGDTFSHVFGSDTSLLESFLLKRGLAGPAWLRVYDVRPLDAGDAPPSWCAAHAVVTEPKNITLYAAPLKLFIPPPPPPPRPAPDAETVASDGAPAPAEAAPAEKPQQPRVVAECDRVPLPLPPLIVTSLCLRTVIDPKTHFHEIVAAALVTHSAVSAEGVSSDAPALLSSKLIVRPLSSSAPLPATLPSALAALPKRARDAISVERSERALLETLFTALRGIDPDCLMGHNILGFDLDLLLHRAEALKLSGWSVLGRLRRARLPSSERVTGAARMRYLGNVTPGRLVADTYTSAREFLQQTTYTLTALAATQLGERRVELELGEVAAHLTGDSPDAVLRLLRFTEHDARLVLRLSFWLQLLPLTKQLTNLAGNTWARCLRGARAERIEYLLLHEFHREKFVVPDRVLPDAGRLPLAHGKGKGVHASGAGGGASGGAGGGGMDEDVIVEMEEEEADDEAAETGKRGIADGSSSSSKRRHGGGSSGGGSSGFSGKKRAKAAYKGGLVLAPKSGYYDKYILLLDFNSLYPSIIQEYNICFTTVDRSVKPQPAAGGDAAAAEGDEAADGGGSAALPALPDRVVHRELGILPRVIQELVKKRREVKRELAREEHAARAAQLDIRQKALKILANSMYGCLGFSLSRFYAKPLAALVTSQGRDILQRTVKLAQDAIGCEVIYGDTDSIMIYTGVTDLKQVKALGAAVKKEVNKLYRYLEIEIDAIFASMLLLQKKKYAALVVSEKASGEVTLTREMKGLDMVRRDWCVLSRELGTQVLDIILSQREREEVVDDIHAKLRSVADDLAAAKFGLEKFVISRGLNKPASEYGDAKSMPHVSVALSMIAAGKTVGVGDIIPFVICKQELKTTLPLIRALEAPSTAQPASPTLASTASALPGSPDMDRGHVLQGDATQRSTSPSEGGATSPMRPAASSAAAPASATSASFAQRAFHPTDAAKGMAAGLVSIDTDWYTSQQLLPPITRLCEHIEGTSTAQLAVCLGMDAGRFAHSSGSSGRADDGVGFVPRYALNLHDRFVHAEKLHTYCHKCRNVATFPGVFATVAAADGVSRPRLRSGLLCTQPWCEGVVVPLPLRPSTSAASPPPPLETPAPIPDGLPLHELAYAQFCVLVRNACRAYVLRAQQGVYNCSDSACPLHMSGTRAFSLRKNGFACPRTGCMGLMRASVALSETHNQLEYLHAMFNVDAAIRTAKKEYTAALASRDPSTALEVPPLPELHVQLFRAVQAEVRTYLAASAYHFVNPSLFDYIAAGNASSTLMRTGVKRAVQARTLGLAPTPSKQLRTAAGV